MKLWRQARWEEPLILEKRGSSGGPRTPFEEQFPGAPEIPEGILRSDSPSIPSIPEIEVVRHYTRLAQMSYGIDSGPVPLGSCTMKYNPKILDLLVSDPRILYAHPLQDERTVQGILEIIYITERWLAEITGMERCSFQPPAGSAGEFAGALMIRKYHLDRGEARDEMLIPDSAHGSNSASAAMAGFKVVRIPTDEGGEVSLDALKAALGPRTAGIMLTNPNTLGIFESRILEISELVHGAGGLLYYDGANLNGILGVARPGDMGFDIVHLNLHKTFATPHGGGGPGGGAVCAKGELVDYLPRPLIEKDGELYRWDYRCEKCMGAVRAFYGNVVPIVRTFLYISMLGPEGLRTAGETSVINTNYFVKRLLEKGYYELPYSPDRPRKHEVVISARKIAKEAGVSAEDIAKALLDEGLHAPTIYFPQIVEEALMIEFTEGETLETLDRYAEILNRIAEEAYKDGERVGRRPHNTSASRVDNVRANHPKTLTPSYKILKKVFEARRGDVH